MAQTERAVFRAADKELYTTCCHLPMGRQNPLPRDLARTMGCCAVFRARAAAELLNVIVTDLCHLGARLHTEDLAHL